jgi:hypothetical protein
MEGRAGSRPGKGHPAWAAVSGDLFPPRAVGASPDFGFRRPIHHDLPLARGGGPGCDGDGADLDGTVMRFRCCATRAAFRRGAEDSWSRAVSVATCTLCWPW